MSCTKREHIGIQKINLRFWEFVLACLCTSSDFFLQDTYACYGLLCEHLPHYVHGADKFSCNKDQSYSFWVNHTVYYSWKLFWLVHAPRQASGNFLVISLRSIFWSTDADATTFTMSIIGFVCGIHKDVIFWHICQIIKFVIYWFCVIEEKITLVLPCFKCKIFCRLRIEMSVV